MSDRGSVGSVSALARAVGRGRSTVQRHMAQLDWPFSREGPWKVAPVKAYFDGLKPDNRLTSHDQRSREVRARALSAPLAHQVRELPVGQRVKARLAVERARLLRVQRRQLEKTHVPFSYFEEQMVARAQIYKAGFQRLSDRVLIGLEDYDVKTRQIVADVIAMQAQLFLTDMVNAIHRAKRAHGIKTNTNETPSWAKFASRKVS